ncbi:trigger factor [Flavobacteriaceae bacterium]|jgi:trigger factor|nr:trigger factor [Flavobacteriaceae bacterium]MDA9037992.1 trigger factor [Flavobacteriaceae bacterium]MDA9851696.1 trigger factor [Flavobacteriaceae bacterium]
MHISKTDIDALNAVIQITVERKDYEEKVSSVLNDYRKNANIPGFRKGHVPMGMIKKQYEQAVVADEVNKILRENLDKYIQEEKLELLGNPIPKASEEGLDWKASQIDFEFELGLAPKFDIKLDVLKKVIRYEIEPDSKMIQEQLTYIQKQYGKLVSQTKIQKDFEITAQFRNEEIELETMVNFTIEDIKSKNAVKALKEATTGTVLNFSGKGLFKDDDTAKRLLALDDKKIEEISSAEITVELKEINERIPATLNQELFDKLYEAGTVTSEQELKDKIKAGLQAQFEPQVNQKLMNDISEALVEKTKFKLPDEFLKKWIQTSGKEPMTEAEANDEFNKSEKGIRYQLIEGKIINENELNLTFEELKEYAAVLVKNQMMQYGQIPDQEQLDGIVSNVMSNQEETKKLSEQLMGEKMLNFFKEKAPLKIKKVGFDAFVKEAYGKA